MSGQALNLRNLFDDLGRPALQFAALGGMIDLEISLHGGQQAHELFLADFHTAADTPIGADRILCRFYQVFSAQEQTGALRAQQPFPPEKATRSNPSLTYFESRSPEGCRRRHRSRWELCVPCRLESTLWI